MFKTSEGKATLALAYVAGVLLVICIGILAAVRLGIIQRTADDLTTNLAADVILSKEIVNQILLTRYFAHEYVNTGHQTDLDDFNQAFASLDALLHQADQQITRPERVEMLSRIHPAVEAYGEAFEDAATLIRRRQRMESEVLDVRSLQIDDSLTALRMHVVSVEDPRAFLAVGNARNAFQTMRLNATRYLESGDERYNVLFEAGHQQLLGSLSSLEDTLASPAQRKNASEARAAVGAYWDGFRAIHEDSLAIDAVFEERLDELEPEISSTASDIVASVQQEFESQNAVTRTLISQTRWVLVLTTTIVALTSVGLGVVVSRRMAERARAEEALRAARDQLEVRVRERTAELKQANDEIKHFAYIVSHDLRAPLVNPKGFSAELRFALDEIQSIVDHLRPHLDDAQRQRLHYAMDEDVPEALDFIESSVTRMDNFIAAVLRLSRLGRRELHPERVDVEALCHETLESFAHQIEELDVEVAVEPLPQVVADRTSMEQIVGNLLDNALKYLEPDRPGQIEITGRRNGEKTTFSVRDNGRGIGEEDLDKVFAPFRRAGRQDAPGEGMGLPYVQTLVRRHDGRIWCESEPGKGTTFTFTIGNQIEGGERRVAGGTHSGEA